MREPTPTTPGINFCFDRPPLFLLFFGWASRRIDLFLSVIPQREKVAEKNRDKCLAVTQFIRTRVFYEDNAGSKQVFFLMFWTKNNNCTH